MTDSSKRKAPKHVSPSGPRSPRSLAEFYYLVVEERDRERQRIAEELHDGALQFLSTLNLKLEQLLYEIQGSMPSEVAGQLSDLARQVRGCVKEIRAIVLDLELPDLEDTGAIEALHQCIDAFSRRQSVDVLRRIEPVQADLSSAQKLGLFRILQEALNNVAKHSEATRVEVEVKHIDDMLSLSIRDNGRGFGSRGKNAELRRHGLKYMSNRAAALGGSVSVQSSANGVVVAAKIPITDD